MNGMLFEAFLCQDETLVAIFHDQVFRDPITINQRSFSSLEYTWTVMLDVDSDESTGSTERFYHGIAGVDYELSLSRWSNGEVKTVPFDDAFQTDVWQVTSESISAYSDLEFYADKTSKIIILRGIIPGIDLNTRIFFFRYHLTEDNAQNYQTGYAYFQAIQ